MTKRELWRPEEFELVLGAYLSIPYFDGKIPTPENIVQIIASKFGVNRTVGSIKIRLSNFASVDPIKIAAGFKGMDAAREYCEPYFKKWSNNKVGLLARINEILDKPNIPTLDDTVSTIYIVSEPEKVIYSSSKWYDTELYILFYLAYTRVNPDNDNPLLLFFSTWFNHSIFEVVSVVEYFKSRLKSISVNEPIVGCESIYLSFLNNSEATTLLGKTVWRDCLQHSFENYIDTTINVTPILDTILIEDPIKQLVKELNSEGLTKLTIIEKVMSQFGEKGYSLAKWNNIVNDYLSEISIENNSIETSVNSFDTKELETPGYHKQVRNSPRTKIRSIKVENHIITESNPTDMFVDYIKFIGPELVSMMDFPFRGGQLVSKTIHPKYVTACKDVGDGFFVNTNSNTQTKIEQIKAIAANLDISVEVETYTKE